MENLSKILKEGFALNSKQHERIEKCLFGNGEVGIVGKVARHEELIENLQEMHERILTKLENIEGFNARLTGQLSLWKYLVSVLGIGNIASAIYFFVK